MQKKAVVLFLVCFMIWIGYSCRKDVLIHENQTIHKDTIVNGNKAPVYNGVSSLEINAYLNRLSIDVIGRQPTAAELNLQFSTLSKNPKSDSLRGIIVNQLIASPEYTKRMFALISDKLIGGADSNDIAGEITIHGYLKTLYEKQGEKYYVNYFTLELAKLYQLLFVIDNYQNKKYGIDSVYAIFIGSYFYDQINMGNENFVKACFENLLYRNPTKDELANGKNMYDNKAAILFRKTGICKNDIIKILIAQEEFYQGLVIEMYSNILLRKPTPVEIAQETPLVIAANRTENLRIKLLKSKEYAGF